MQTKDRVSRRGVLAGSGASLALPSIWTSAQAQAATTIKIAKGGWLGKKIELLIEDTAGNPAACVRKAQEMVERQDCRLFTGITLSSEALAIVPKLAEWNAIFISSDNGDGRLTAESFVPNFF